MATQSIVLELQELAADGEVAVDVLLRKSLLVASKLSLAEFRQWIEYELNGYVGAKELPEYRYVVAQLHALNPYQGMVRYVVEEELEVMFSRTPISQPIGSIAEIEKTQGNRNLHFPIPRQLLKELIRRQGEFALEPVLVIDRTHVVMILDAVRNAILQWSLKLEEKGILGEGMTFTKEEKQRAMTIHNTNIGNFQGIYGNVANSDVTQNLTMEVKAGDFKSLSKALEQLGVNATDLKELKAAVAADPHPESKDSFGPKTGGWIGTVLGKAAGGALKVTLETAAKMIPGAIAAYYGFGP